MTPGVIRIDTEQVARLAEKPVEIPGQPPRDGTRPRDLLRPELRAAIRRSWERNEAAYRRLGQ